MIIKPYHINKMADMNNTDIFLLPKYKNKTFEQVFKKIVSEDLKYLSYLNKQIKNVKITPEKKENIQNFLEYYYKKIALCESLELSESSVETTFQSDEETTESQETGHHANIVEEAEPIKSQHKTIKLANMNITKIFHISDIHIRLLQRHDEYRHVFSNLYSYLAAQNCDKNGVVVITGDILHNKNQLSPECIILCREFITQLSQIMTTIFIAGNHDAVLSNLERIDSLSGVLTNNQDDGDYIALNSGFGIYYLKNTAVYNFGNVNFVVQSILDGKWINACDISGYDKTVKNIALYHGGVGIAETSVGFRLRGEKILDDFAGFDYVLLGDIHRYQFIGGTTTVAYSSSLIAQDFSETDAYHGVLVWDLECGQTEYVPIANKWGFHSIEVVGDSIYLERIIVPKNIKVRFSLDELRAISGEKLIADGMLHENSKIRILLKNTKNDIVKTICDILALKCNVLETSYQIMSDEHMDFIFNKAKVAIKDQEISHNMPIKDMVEKFVKIRYNGGSIDTTQVTQSILTELEQLDQYKNVEISHKMQNWCLERIEFSNMFAYGSGNIIDFTKPPPNSIIGMFAPNSSGKSTLIDIILFGLYGRVARQVGAGVCKDLININADTFDMKLFFSIGSDKYVIEKSGKRVKSSGKNDKTESVKITVEKLYKIVDNGGKNGKEYIDHSDDDRIKTDKVINQLIGKVDEFLFTSVQLQYRDRNFREMMNTERKKFLVQMFRLNIFENLIPEVAAKLKEFKRRKYHLEETIRGYSEETLLINVAENKQKYVKLTGEISTLEENKIAFEKERALLLELIGMDDIDTDMHNKYLELKDKIRVFGVQIEEIKKSIAENVEKIAKYEKIVIDEDDAMRCHEEWETEKGKKICEIDGKIEAATKSIDRPVILDKTWYKNYCSAICNVKLSGKPIEQLQKNNLASWLKTCERKCAEFTENVEELKKVCAEEETWLVENEDVIMREYNDFISKRDKTINELIKSKERLIYDMGGEVDEDLITEEDDINEQMEKCNKTIGRLRKEIVVLEDYVKKNKICGDGGYIEQDIISLGEYEDEEKELECKKGILENDIKEFKEHKWDPKCQYCKNGVIVKKGAAAQKEYDAIILRLDDIKELKDELLGKYGVSNVKELTRMKNVFEKKNAQLGQTKNEMRLEEKNYQLLHIKCEQIKIEKEKMEIIKENSQKIKEINYEIGQLSSSKFPQYESLGLRKKSFAEKNEALDSLEKEITLLEAKIHNIKLLIDVLDKNSRIDAENKLFENKIDELKKEKKVVLATVDDVYAKWKVNKRELDKCYDVDKQLSYELSKTDMQYNYCVEEHTKICAKLGDSDNVSDGNSNMRENLKRIVELKAFIQNAADKLLEAKEKYGALKIIIANDDEKINCLKEHKVELAKCCEKYDLYLMIDDMMGKNGLSLILLNNYLPLIRDGVNAIINPFIHRQIDIFVDGDKVEFESFPVLGNSGKKSVAIHGGMEGFIIDLAFKMVLSQMAILPKCDLLILDEGISAFDKERLNNIELLLNFIRANFTKTILISHIEGIRDYIPYQLDIEKNKLNQSFIRNV